MTRCAIYARVSTTKQAEQNISIPDQLRRCREFAQTRGLEVVLEFIDPGASARDDRRPQFQDMIQSAREKPRPFDIILVHSFSRFFRDEVEFEVYRRDLEKRGVAIVSITQELSEGTGGEITRRIIALMDEMRSKEDAKHVKRGMQENARQGFWNGAPAPFGYKIIAAEKRGERIKKKLEVDPVEAEIVKSIYDLFLNGDGENGPLGVRAIVSWLNARGHKTKRGGLFYVSGVHAILTNETYSGTAWFNRKNTGTGQMRPRSEWIELRVPAIVPKESFQQVQVTLRQRRPKNTPPRTISSQVLLSGIAVCEGCGKPLMMATGKGGAYRYYKCSEKCLKGACSGGVAVTIRQEKLDQLSVDALADRVLTPERTIEIVDAVVKRREANRSGANQTLNQLRGQLGRTNSRIRNLYNALADGVASDSEMFREALEKEEVEREGLLRLIDNEECQEKDKLVPIDASQAKRASEKLKSLIRAAPIGVRKRYLRAFVSEIRVGEGGIVISGPKEAIAEAASGRLPAGQAGGDTKVRSFVPEWLPFVNAYRTLCQAPKPEFRMLLQEFSPSSAGAIAARQA